MVATIARPGVQVIQEFRTTSPTIFIPALPACVLGPCFQVIEAVQDSGSLNSEAKITLPARLTFAYVGATYTGVGGLVLQLSVDNAAPVSIALSALPANKTPAEIADEINEALIPDLLAEVETSGSSSRVVLRTLSKGENASIEVGSLTNPTLLTQFAITSGYRVTGALGYSNYFDFGVQLADYPDPRSNLDLLTVDYDTVRIFMDNGAGTVYEALRTETFLDGAGTAVAVVDDGDGDNLSPYLSFTGAEFTARNAAVVGSVDLTALSGAAITAAFDTFTLVVRIDGGAALTTTFAATTISNITTQINAVLLAAGTASINALGQLVITSATAPGATATGSVEIDPTSTITLPTIGFIAYQYGGPKAGYARAQGVTDVRDVGAGGSVTYTTQVQNRVLRMSVDGGPWQQITFSTSVTGSASLLTAIDGLWGAGTASLSTVGNRLVLRGTAVAGGITIRGKESVVRIDKTASDATLLAALGLTGVAPAPFGTAGTGTAAVWGTAYAPAVGDEVWVDGRKVGQIVEVPASSVNRLKISAEQLLTFTGTSWTVQAKGLDNDLWTTTRPSTDLYIDTNTGTTRVKHELFRDSSGTPTLAGPLSTYLGYRALRRDVTPNADSFELLRIGSVTDLETQLSPIDTQNPLGLGMYFAILNAPTLEVTGCGVSETTTTEPDGSLDAYTESFEYLESKDVYAIAPLTHASEVGDIAQVHVDAMSLPENGLERIAILNPSRPTRKSSTLVASGPLANVSGPPTNDVNTGVANVQALLAALGLPGPFYTIADRVYLEFEDDTNKYLVESVLGGVVTIDDGPLTGNDDGFFLDGGGTPVFTSAIVDRPFSIKIRGAALANRTEEATAYADVARGYLDRRVVATAPAQAKATIDGLETIIEGYYLSAALAGKISSKLPQQPLTEASITGFTGVVGSHDRYSEAQLQILSGGGLFVFYQQATGQPVRVRHQLTTDMTTVEKRELSITTAVDFAAKLIRTSLRNFIGQFNITTTVQDAITSTMEGIRSLLLRLGVFESFEVNAIRQNATDPTKLEIDVTVGVFYPLNYIQVTLVI